MAEESLRETLTSAFETSEAPASPVVDTPSAPVSPGVSDAPPPPPVEAPPGERERVRDEHGRFAPQPKRDLLAAPPPDALKPTVPTDAHPVPGQGDAKPIESIKAPNSWKPEQRAKFAALAPDVQAEIVRRESEITRGLAQMERERGEAGTARTALGELQKVIAPFYANIQAAHNGNVVGAIQLLLSTDHKLRHGSTGEKAQVVVDIIRNYGVDIPVLDSTLAGAPRPDDPSEVMARRLRAEIDSRMQPVMTLFQQHQQREREFEAELSRDVGSELQKFAESHEHYETVKGEMVNWMEVAGKQGLTLSLQDAYDRAIMLNPTLSAEVEKRKESERVAAAAEAAQRARRAATSLPSGGAPSGSPPGANGQTNLRDSVVAAFAAHESR